MDETGVFTLDVNGCARCHGDGHEQLEFRPFTYPVVVVWGGGPDVRMTHWALCPENGEPILYSEHEEEVP